MKNHNVSKTAHEATKMVVTDEDEIKKVSPFNWKQGRKTCTSIT